MVGVAQLDRVEALQHIRLTIPPQSDAYENSTHDWDRSHPDHPNPSTAERHSQRSGTSTTRKPSGSSKVSACSAQYGFAGRTGSIPRRFATAWTPAVSPR